ncbi:hypothetical protein AK812_SmicGene17138 [Symbiodinium microadriaticum]|uniref:Uncharacterized protein n=1 Tax=Symbiodinium microadriaticum TaxID=2951 RepID=A0A1Q9DYK3_SYMMI|nr:hypothetical protein AK812_SmicGene17138 [Symbiodinium microadriaticum]
MFQGFVYFFVLAFLDTRFGWGDITFGNNGPPESCGAGLAQKEPAFAYEVPNPAQRSPVGLDSSCSWCLGESQAEACRTSFGKSTSSPFQYASLAVQELQYALQSFRRVLCELRQSLEPEAICRELGPPTIAGASLFSRSISSIPSAPTGGKGKQAETPPEAPVVKAPSLEQLPAPPAAAATSAPKAAGGPSTAASSTPEKQQLDALLKILRTTKTPLPSEAQQMMEQLQQNQSQQEAKNMHRAVSQQSTAKKELERVRAARSLFLQQWAQYISGLADLLQQQMEEQEETLASFDQKEAQWQEALAKSSAELKQLTDCPTLDVQEVQESEDEMEVQAAEEMVDKAIAEEQQMKARREEQRQQSKQLQATLETMKQQAQHRAEEAKRDGSRTPRRQTSQQAADGPTTEAKGDDKKPKDAEAKASAVPGQVPVEPWPVRNLTTAGENKDPTVLLPMTPFAEADNDRLQVPGPDHIQGRAILPDTVQPEPIGDEHEMDDSAHLQLQQRVQLVARNTDGQSLQDSNTTCAATPVIRVSFAPDSYECDATTVPQLIPPEIPETQPPALLWHNFRALETKHGKTEDDLLPRIIPQYFRATQRDQAAMDFSWGGVAGTANAAYATFDVLRHALVRPRRPDATLRDIVEDAIAAAPFVVRAVQVLTSNVPGFPRPQLVLHRREDDPRAFPIPWDLRGVGGRIRTSLHFPGEFFAASVAAVQAVCPEMPHLHDQLLSQNLVALDATGFLGPSLPDDLEEVQFITVERSARVWLADNAGDGTAISSWLFPRPTSTPTTSTTTPVQGEQRRYRFVVRHGTEQAQIEIGAPCLQADAILENLVMDIFTRTTPIYGGVHIMLAKAQPLPVQGVQEVWFLLCGAADSEQATVIADQGACGFPLSTITMAPFARCEIAVPEPWSSQGVHLFVNAAPAHLVQRPASQGDVFQFSTELDYPVALPVTVILDELQILEAYTWPLQFGERPFYPDLMNTARLRRRQQWSWKPREPNIA